MCIVPRIEVSPTFRKMSRVFTVLALVELSRSFDLSVKPSGNQLSGIGLCVLFGPHSTSALLKFQILNYFCHNNKHSRLLGLVSVQSKRL